MKIYNVGPDEVYGDLEEADFEFIVYWYQIGDYCGDGEAVGLCNSDKLIYVKNLGHCSCYGPMDGGMKSGDTMTVQDFLSNKDNIHYYDARDEIKDKVRELLGDGKGVFIPNPVFEERFDLLRNL